MLTDEQRQEIIELLELGEELPDDFKYLLFPPERQEYELVYLNKEREEDIITDTMAVPLQTIRTFGNNGVNWHNILVFGDNLQTMKTLLKMKEQGLLVNADGSQGIKLVYIDPPFATKNEFQSGQEEKAYQDKIVGAQFLEFIRKRLVFLKKLLADNGVIYVHLDWRKGHYIKVLMDEIFKEHNFRNEIIWQRTSARSDSKTYNHIHDTIFFYSKNGSLNFNTQYEEYSQKYLEKFYRYKEEDGKRYSLGDLTARGTRNGETGQAWRGIDPNKLGNHWKVTPSKLDELDAEGRIYWPPTGRIPRLKQYLDERKGIPLQSIWTSISPVQYASKENYSYPTQKPERLLELIIASSSREGDIVLDAFAGSGTTLAVAEKLRRRWIGIDAGKVSIYTIQKRLLNIRENIGNTGKRFTPSPFTLYTAGLYDFARLKELSWDGWRSYALGLFQCRDDLHKINGRFLDGYRGSDHVLVFNHTIGGGVVLDYGFIDQLHSQIGANAGARFFIIAPASSVTFLEDYVDKGHTRYYILRIPYSIVNELHRKEFISAIQPNKPEQLNEIVEAFGFDFIRQPEVECEYFSRQPVERLFKEAVVRIKTFKSEALAKGASQKDNLETLSMVLVDYDYPHDPRRAGNEPSPPFELDEVFYAGDIEKTEWEVRMPFDRLGAYVMLIYVDIYGNEYTEIKKPSDFSCSTQNIEER